MIFETDLYQVRQFVKKVESGEIDFGRSRRIIREVRMMADFYPDHNIMVDMRDTHVTLVNLDELLELIREFAHIQPHFRNKIAGLIPDREERRAIASQFEAMAVEQGINYRVFSDYEAAIEWLSEDGRRHVVVLYGKPTE